MKTHKLQWFIFFSLALAFSSPTASAGLFDDDAQNWRRIFGEIKKINARLVSLEMGKLKALGSVQQDLSRQIGEIKNLIPNLQGSVEQSQAEVSGHFKTTNQKLADIEMQLKLEIIKNVNQQLSQIDQQIATQLSQQKKANDQFQGSLAEKFSDLKGGMAADMENFAKGNQKSIQELARFNSESLAKVVDQMNTQKQSLDKANEIIKNELIPTIIKQNEDTSLLLRTEMSKTSNALLAGMSQARKENKGALLAGLSGIEAKNQKLLEVLDKNLKEGETTRGNIELLSQSMGATNENVIRSHDDIVKLKDVLVQQMDTLSKGQQNLAVQVVAGSQKTDQKVDLVFRNLRVEDEKLNKLITSSSELVTQSNEMGQSIDQLAAHSGEVNQSLKNVGQVLQTIEGRLANVDNVNEKLTTLIDILKSIAAEQGKFAEVIAGQAAIKQSQNQIFKSQTELNQVQVKMSQAQAEMSQAQIQMGKNQGVINQAQLDEKQILEQTNQHQARNLKAQEEIRSSQIQIIKAQEEIRNAQRQALKTQVNVKKNLADLSRKANVNISRNDSIRKALATLGKKTSLPRPRKQ